jgi:hypothetical protein
MLLKGVVSPALWTGKNFPVLCPREIGIPYPGKSSVRKETQSLSSNLELWP